MKRVLSLVVALGVAALFSGATLAGAECNPAHKTTAAVDRTEAPKDVATAPVPDKPVTDQVQTAQSNPQPKAAATMKK